MHPTIRSALVLLGGVVAAVVVVGLMDALAGRLYALPPGTDPTNPESFRQAVATLPAQAFLLLLAGWVLAGGIGAYIAARLATHARATHGLIVAFFVLVATVGNSGDDTAPGVDVAGLDHPHPGGGVGGNEARPTILN